MRWFGRKTYRDEAVAAGVEVARLRREKEDLLQEIADLRELYSMSLADRCRLQARLDQYGVGRPRNLVTERPRGQQGTAPVVHRATTPSDPVASGTR